MTPPTKPHFWLFALIGLLVPRRLRRDWRREWEAELRHREAVLADWNRLDRRHRIELVRRSASAFWDAFWLQRQRWEDDMVQDVRFGLRLLRRNPGFTLIAVHTLALGIGANTAIFSLLDKLVVRALPVDRPQELVTFVDQRGEALWGEPDRSADVCGDPDSAGRRGAGGVLDPGAPRHAHGSGGGPALSVALSATRHRQA